MTQLKVKNIVFGQGKPKVCIPLVAKNVDDLVKQAYEVSEIKADVIEWRIDHFDQVLNQKELITAANKLKEIIEDKVLLVTFRSFKEGGVLDISDEEYLEIYKGLIGNTAIDILDIEVFMPEAIVDELVNLCKVNNTVILMCNHDFNKTPPEEEIIRRLRLMQDRGAMICKIALMPQNAQDVLTLLSATLKMKEKYAQCPLITMSMGGLGAISRMAGQVFGSTMSFGVGTEASAPGQIDAGNLNLILETINQGLE